MLDEINSQAFDPHAEDKLHLRLHRARSVVLTSEELVEIRAAQRTYEGAYMRTALSQFSFALIILKIFTSEFYPIGALFAVYGFCVLLVAVYRRHEGNRQFFNEEVSDSDTSPARHGVGGRGDHEMQPLTKRKFRTSGNSVALLAALSLGAYITLLWLIWNMEA
ncbi:hypothetical protein M0657_001188 [Pyricularia oryzae]|nr:hypothetical protein M9X92_003832 [Pyricularia oryzae]KAI7931234.1 hypothetical protein M0657_001188 [Pyricularia oryzae]